jgi:hypothetical protein
LATGIILFLAPNKIVTGGRGLDDYCAGRGIAQSLQTGTADTGDRCADHHQFRAGFSEF